jgi:hypothetical protein
MQTARIPKRVPVGTKYVVEGKSGGAGQVMIYSRYLVFPDGRHFDLPADQPVPATSRRRRSAGRH